MIPSKRSPLLALAQLYARSVDIEIFRKFYSPKKYQVPVQRYANPNGLAV